MSELYILAEAAAESNKFGITEVLAIIGGLYTITRTIIWFTPTKRDDKVLKRVNKWLITFKVITGLSLNQGLKKHGP